MTTLDLVARLLPSLGVIVGALLVLRHWANRAVGGHTGDALRVVTRTGITKGAVVAVVAVGDQRMLIGATEHGVSLLTPLEGTDDGALAPPPPRHPDAIEEMVPHGDLTTSAFGLCDQISDERPRMAPTDRLRRLTVRQPVPSHPPRPNNGARPPA